MSKRIMTTYGKLNSPFLLALKADYLHGVVTHLIPIKNVIKGYLFQLLVFIYQDITYLFEWNKNDISTVTYFNSDIVFDNSTIDDLKVEM